MGSVARTRQEETQDAQTTEGTAPPSEAHASAGQAPRCSYPESPLRAPGRIGEGLWALQPAACTARLCRACWHPHSVDCQRLRAGLASSGRSAQGTSHCSHGGVGSVSEGTPPLRLGSARRRPCPTVARGRWPPDRFALGCLQRWEAPPSVPGADAPRTDRLSPGHPPWVGAAAHQREPNAWHCVCGLSLDLRPQG